MESKENIAKELELLSGSTQRLGQTWRQFGSSAISYACFFSGEETNGTSRFIFGLF